MARPSGALRLAPLHRLKAPGLVLLLALSPSVKALDAIILQLKWEHAFQRAGFAYQTHSPCSAGIDFYGDNLFPPKLS